MKLRANLETVELRRFDPDRMVELLPQARLDHFLLRSADCRLHHQRWECGGVAIDTGQYSFPVSIAGEFSPGRVCIGYMRQLSVPTWVNGFEADLTTLEYYPAGNELNYRAGENGQWLGITVEESMLQEAACEWIGREVSLPQNAMVSFQIGPALRGELDQSIRQLTARAKVSRLVLTAFLGGLAELIDRLSGADAAAALRASRKRRQQIACANAYLRRHVDCGFDLAGMAAAAGTSMRTLQRLYAETYGMSPNHWARCLALHRVRDRLRRTDAESYTIEGIAREFGFNHMGRFSRYFRELFGECPSETLAFEVE